MLVASHDDGEWRPAYSMVSGLLPASEFTSNDAAVALVRGHVEVSSPGQARLHVNSVGGLKLWLDEKEIPLQEKAIVELERGRRALTFAVDPSKRGNVGLWCELEDITGSPARFQVVGGP